MTVTMIDVESAVQEFVCSSLQVTYTNHQKDEIFIQMYISEKIKRCLVFAHLHNLCEL